MYQLSETPYWREERTRRRNKDYQENHLDRVEYARDHFTAASGGTYYGGDAYPQEYYGNIFTGDSCIHDEIKTINSSTASCIPGCRRLVGQITGPVCRGRRLHRSHEAKQCKSFKYARAMIVENILSKPLVRKWIIVL